MRRGYGGCLYGLVEPPRPDVAQWYWPFGKYKGVLLSETPISYLGWVAENFGAGPIRSAAMNELDRRCVKFPPVAELKAVVVRPENGETEQCPFDVDEVTAEYRQMFS